MPSVGEADMRELLDDEADDFSFEEPDGGDEYTEDELGNLDPTILKSVERILAEREAALVKAIESGDTKNGVYKGLQKQLSKRDRENIELKQQLEAAVAKLQQFEGLADELTEGLNWASDVMLGALPDEDKQSALQNLESRKSKLALKDLERRLKNPSGNRVTSSSGDGNLPEYVIEGRRKFIEMSKATAERFGVDPDNGELDFGDDEDALIVRMEKFNSSLEKLLQDDKLEARVSALRKKTEPVTTRTGGSGGASAGTRRVSLDEVSDKLMRELRRADFRR